MTTTNTNNRKGVARDIEIIAEQVASLTIRLDGMDERFRTLERRMTKRMESVEGDLRDEITGYRLEFVDLRLALDPLKKWAER